MKNRELRELSSSELRERLVAETEKYQKMRLNHKISPLDKPSEITEQRRLIARLKTVIRDSSK